MSLLDDLVHHLLWPKPRRAGRRPPRRQTRAEQVAPEAGVLAELAGLTAVHGPWEAAQMAFSPSVERGGA